MERMRLAIVSTPRTGNCWLRHMLTETLELHHIIVHRPHEVAWHHLPERAIVQVHWLPDDGFTSLLAEHGFRVVTNCRHPLDVLISILAFSQHDDSTLRWLGGANDHDDERSIQGASPVDDAFLQYSLGPRAACLLGVSSAWWSRPETLPVRYEDLLHNPAGELDRLLANLGATARRSTAEVASRSTPDHMRSQNIHMLYHVWQAQDGLWKRFLPSDRAQQICAAHGQVLAALGYSCDPDDSLTVEAAQIAWERFDVAALKRNLFGVKRQVCEINQRNHCQLQEQQAAFEAQRLALDAQRRELADLRNSLESARRQLEEVPVDLLRRLQELGPWSLDTAETLHRWSGRFPRVSASVKALFRPLRRSSS